MSQGNKLEMSPSKSITPLMLRSFGRSGSTLMMSLLGTSPNVLFERTFPYEERYLTYLVRLTGLLKKPPQNSKEWNYDTVLKRDLTFVGPMPYSNPGSFDKNKLADQLLLAAWDIFSQQQVNNHSKQLDLEVPIYFAEKTPTNVPDILGAIMTTKNIYLLRDPRDEFLSIRSFNQKRGYKGFGWLQHETEISFVKRFCKHRKPFLGQFLSLKEEEHSIKVLYESLLSDPISQQKKLSSWLGLKLDHEKVEHRNQHATSSSPEVSVGKWKNELSEELKTIFNSTIGSELSALGYDV